MRVTSFPCRIVAMYFLSYVAAVLHHLKTRSLPVPGRLICRVSSCGRQGQYFRATIRAPCGAYGARLAHAATSILFCAAAPASPKINLNTTYIWRLGKHRTVLGGYRCTLLHPLSASGADGDLLSQLSGALSDVDSHAPRGCPRHPSRQRSCCIVPYPRRRRMPARISISAVQRGQRGMECCRGTGCRGRQNQGEGDGTTKAGRWQSATSATQAARIYWYRASTDPAMINDLAY